MKIHEFSGTHHEVGRQHGEALREGVRESLGLRMSRCLEISRSAGKGEDPDALRALGRECLKHVGEFSPGMLEEVKGIAEGAGVSPEEILITSGYTDFRDTIRSGGVNSATECTACWAGPGATTDGTTFVAQTWDMFSEAEDGVVWLKLAVEGEPVVFTLAYAGCVGMTGMNSRGVALAINNLNPTDARPGVPWTFINRAILASESAEEAFAAVKRARLCSGHNYVIGDSSGTGMSVETTGRRLTRIEPDGPTLAHSNHYLDPQLAEIEKPLDPQGSSPQRVRRMDEILREGRGKIDRAFIESALSDHDGKPRSICAHDYEVTGGATIRSCAALIMDTKKREVAYIKGNPCKGEFSTIGL